MDSPAELLAQLRDKLARYDELARESDRLAQEEKTLESYVRNMMDSTVSRGRKAVNYVEEAVGDSDESDFALSDAEAPKKRARAPRSTTTAKRGRPPKVTSTAQRSNDDDTAAGPAPAIPVDDGGAVDNTAAPRTPAKKTVVVVAPADSDDSDSDAYGSEPGAPSASDDDLDYKSDGVTIDIVTSKKPAAEARVPAKQARTAVAKPLAAHKPAQPVSPAKRSAALGSLLSSPVCQGTARPKLPSSSSSLSASSGSSLGSRLGSPTRSPSSAKRRAGGGASLKDLLKGSNVPRAGLSRRVPLKRTVE